MNFNYDKMLDRFLQYVRIDTQSDERSNSYPSTDKQLNLCRILVDQLKSLQLQDIKLTKHGYVFATLPSNLPKNYPKKVPTIGFIAHVDTSPDVSGSNVNPIVHNNYQGSSIKLPKDSEQILNPETDPALRDCLGHDIITSDGSTLLGADNKAGIAEIMTAIDILKNTPSILHGEIKVAFTVDEEIGRGTKYFDVKKFGAKYAYTVDGETAGEIEDETFCADTVTVKISGKNVHPGYAKNKMINSMKIAATLIENLPKDSMSPETTEKKEGYIHPNNISGGVEQTIIKFLIRDFTVKGLKKKEDLLKTLLDKTVKKFSGANADFQIEESYRNMRYILDNYPHVVQYAIKAVERSGIKAKKNLIRGGTDGARLSFMGLPTPNIFTGGHNFHSKKEWISVQNMQKATETIVRLSLLWTEEGDK